MGEALCPSFQNAAAGKALGPADKIWLFPSFLGNFPLFL
jgi:hypothetical protein